MWNQTRVSELPGIRYPIIQGPFGGGLSTIELAAVVSNAGGMGPCGAHHHLSPAQIRDTVAAIKGLTAKPANVTRLKPYYDGLGLPDPELRVLGGALLERAIEVKRRVDNGCPAVEQVTYAQFLRNGELNRHLRRMRNQYRSRRDALLDAMSRHCPGWRVRGAAAGLHCVAEVPDSVDVRRLVERSAARSVRLYPLSGYTGRPPIRHGLVCGYARLHEREIAEGVRRIGRVPAGAAR